MSGIVEDGDGSNRGYRVASRLKTPALVIGDDFCCMDRSTWTMHMDIFRDNRGQQQLCKQKTDGKVVRCVS